MNIWLLSKNAREIAKELQLKYSGYCLTNDLRHIVHQDFESNESYKIGMYLVINKDELDMITWFQIGIPTHFVPISKQNKIPFRWTLIPQ